jgi:hypothetical protein
MTEDDDARTLDDLDDSSNDPIVALRLQQARLAVSNLRIAASDRLIEQAHRLQAAAKLQADQSQAVLAASRQILVPDHSDPSDFAGC